MSKKSIAIFAVCIPLLLSLGSCAISKPARLAQSVLPPATASSPAVDPVLEAKRANEAAIAAAEEAYAQSEAKAEDAGFGGNPQIAEAKRTLELSKAQFLEQKYQDSTANAYETLNYTRMSDAWVDGDTARLAKEAEEKAAAEKLLADPVMAEAHERMAWADTNSIGKDYPKQYKEASTSMAAAELAYQNKRYASAQALASGVSGTITDTFKTTVISDRKLAEAKALSEKAASDKAIAEAERAKAEALADQAKKDAEAGRQAAEKSAQERA
ncbi:MAG TPA: hypothetical protein VIO60_03265, partial [Rectinemataceae bacterium]